MKIYSEGQEWATVPKSRKKGGCLFVRLVGINIFKDNGRTNVNPVYQAVIEYRKIGDMIVITFAWDKPISQIVLRPNWPFVIFTKFDKFTLEDE
jgi:hypothetical protein